MPQTKYACLTRRAFLTQTGIATGAVLAGARIGRAEAQALKSITASHSVSTVVYAQHLVAAQKKFFEEEGLRTPDFVVPGGGAKVVQALAAGQVMFALGDSNHPLKITEKGKDALIIFATDTRCSYANVVARKELFDKVVETFDDAAVNLCLILSIKLHDAQNRPLVDTVFVPGIRHLMVRKDVRWVNEVWSLRQGKPFFLSLSAEHANLILEAVFALRRIDHGSDAIVA